MRIIDRAQLKFSIKVILLLVKEGDGMGFTRYVWNKDLKVKTMYIYYPEGKSEEDIADRIATEIAICLGKDYQYVKGELCVD